MIRDLRSTLFQVLIWSIILQCLSCTKFEADTELIHFRSTKKRIEGLKKITVWKIGDYDMLQYFKSKFGEFTLDFSLSSLDQAPKGSGFNLTVRNSDSTLCKGAWWFNQTVDEIGFSFRKCNKDTTNMFPGIIQGAIGQIVKLNNKEMWLRGYATDTADEHSFLVKEEIQFVTISP